MAVESKTFPAGASAIAPARTVRTLAIPVAYRRHFVWAQVVVAFLFLEFVLWAPRPHLRNRWALISMITILALVLVDRPSLQRLGLRLPKTFGASVALGISFLMIILMVVFVNWAGGQIPANQTWPALQTVGGYVIWAMIQEFILQSFFFIRFEELYGGPAAVWMASTLFAVAHLPSPILTTATLIGALFFCEMFRRYRSIYPIGVVHALLGLTIFLVTPDSLLHRMRVGIRYLTY